MQKAPKVRQMEAYVNFEQTLSIGGSDVVVRAVSTHREDDLHLEELTLKCSAVEASLAAEKALASAQAAMLAAKDKELARLRAGNQCLEEVLKAKEAAHHATIASLHADRKRKPESDEEENDGTDPAVDQRAYDLQDARARAKEMATMHDADQDVMLARHGFKLGCAMTYGRWRCGCGQGGNREFVKECFDPFQERLCSMIECKCGEFKCEKTNTRALERHFNTVCGFFDDGELLGGGQMRPVIRRKVVVVPVVLPLARDDAGLFLARVETFMADAASVMAERYSTHRQCYEAILANVRWRGVRLTPFFKRVDLFKAGPPCPMDTPPWPFRHPAYPAPYEWQNQVRMPVDPRLGELMPDYSMDRPEGWGVIAADRKFLASCASTVHQGVVVESERVWNKRRAVQAMAAAEAAMQLEYATHAECCRAMHAAVGSLFDRLPWPFRDPRYPPPEDWVDMRDEGQPDLGGVMPDYTLPRPGGWPGIVDDGV
jgi:hypothetical protein